jgi:hypothetical protein
MNIRTLCAALLLIGMVGCSKPSVKPLTFDEVTYSQTGGIAGFDQRLTIRTDGSYQVSDRGKTTRTGKLTTIELGAVQKALALVDWPSVPAKYVDPRVADALFDSVTLKTSGKVYETVIGTGAVAPAELVNLMTQLKQTMTAHR